ncbi:hypothetical protein EKH57_09190 [Halorubrum sp. BOL3-1]|uniref:hypothetical protein n=1 Tax=Halorubrum sp. BOL3-1 TaxID=2497325 RepID=UPI001004D82A|nr:hypothetical protein [Halorubrum sp. BOL3-1]QAU12885.1 hypothetical protein EKH57_09190 [Halorubrum sp. BOL3-1]
MSPNRHQKRFARRRLLQALGSAGTIGLAGCGAVPSGNAADGRSGKEGDTADALPRFCEIQVLTPGDADPYRFDVTVTVGREGETVYDDTREVGKGFILADDEGVDWLGDRARYRVTISSAAASETATYDTADATENPDFDGCHAYIAFVDEDGVSGGLWSGTSDAARNASDD